MRTITRSTIPLPRFSQSDLRHEERQPSGRYQFQYLASRPIGERTLLVTLQSANYGSSHEDVLEALSTELHELAITTRQVRIVLDVEKAETYGARFIAVVVNWAQFLRLSGRELAITGDRFEVLRLSRTTIPVSPVLVGSH